MGTFYNVPEVKRLSTPAVFIGDEYLLDELDEACLEAVVGKYLSTGVASRLSEAEGKTGEADETYVGGKLRAKSKRGKITTKSPVIGVVGERRSGGC